MEEGLSGSTLSGTGASRVFLALSRRAAVPVSGGDDRRGAGGAAGLAAEERQECSGTRTGPRWSSGRTEKIPRMRRGGVVARWWRIAGAPVRRDGRVPGQGRPGASRDAGAAGGRGPGQGAVGTIAGRAPLGARLVKGEREETAGQGVHDPGDRADDADAGRAARGRDRRAGRPGTWRWCRRARPWRPSVRPGGRGLAERSRPGSPGRAAGTWCCGSAWRERAERGLPGCGGPSGRRSR